MTGSATNITDAQRNAFEALASGAFANFALFSCFVNGEPASAIVAVTEDGEDITITPLFVSVTPGMILVDHDGTTAGALGRFQVQQHTLCDGWINTWSIRCSSSIRNSISRRKQPFMRGTANDRIEPKADA